MHNNSPLGRLFDPQLPSIQQLREVAASRPISIVFRNLSGETLNVYWLDLEREIVAQCYLLGESGKLRLNSFVGHVFVVVRGDGEESKWEGWTLEDLESRKVVGMYQGKKFLRNGKFHRVTIDAEWRMRVVKGFPPKKKKVDRQYICSSILGFNIRFQTGVFDQNPELIQCLVDDLLVLQQLLPGKAWQLLTANCSIYINTQIVYGSDRTVGRHMCFHSDPAWLRDNGLQIEKAGSIEIYCARDYIDSRKHWGIGGLILHELAHAYHWHCLPEKFECALVKAAYNKAVESGKYQAVRFHGSNIPGKAYALTNQMEYWAELSVAFWGLDDQIEFNKWQPFNRSELAEFDSEGFEVCKKYWEDL